MKMAEQHVVRRGIILAAGEGKRMRPRTLTTPKPLVRVGGRRMIDTVIEALRQNGISEIYVVVGYLKEQFASLPQEYPGLTLIENPWYETCNNISSLYVAREHLADCVILDGDQLVRNPEILGPAFDRSGYNVVWSEGETEEWLLQTENGIITHCSRTGGRHGWQLYSVSRWTAEDGERLRGHLETEFREKKHRDALRKYMGKTAGEVMIAPALTVDVSDSLEKVGNMMFNKQIKRVFVTDDKKLVGVVSRSAFTKLMLKDDEA